MQGTPDPVLGSEPLTLAVAVVIGTFVGSIPFVVERRLSPRRYAAVGGALYAAVVTTLWALPRIGVEGLGCSLPGDLATCGPLALVGVAVLVGQAAVALYAYAEYGSVVPLAATVVVTVLLSWTFLRIRGESDPMALYALFFGPAFVGFTVLLGIAEALVRRAVASSS